ncbi:MAG: hypothetical protein KDD73_03190 [Anaerolineales bacterium]|nr:hypothetical protein [Anaerolineales bacterium]MCB9127316.1 hypothetical protein [Ardenticatenales bacterium]
MLSIRLGWLVLMGVIVMVGCGSTAEPSTPTTGVVTREVPVTREVAVEAERTVEVTRQVTVPVTVLVTAAPVADATPENAATDDVASNALATTVSVAEATSEAAPVGCWPWHEAYLHLSESGCVEGVVSSTGQSASVFFINFSPDRSTFYGVSFDWGWEELAGECVHLTGQISEYNGRPQLIINDPSQMSYCDGGGSPPAFAR